MTANANPEPFSNILLSTVEDIFAIGLAALTAFHSVVILVILIFILLLLWLAPKILRAIRHLLRQIGCIVGEDRAAT